MRRALLPIKTEAATVIVEMRQNKKWAGALGPFPTVRSFSSFTSLQARQSYQDVASPYVDLVNGAH